MNFFPFSDAAAADKLPQHLSRNGIMERQWSPPHASGWKHHDVPPIVFIGGLHRSGTSLTHEILRQHPDASGFHNTGVPEDEGQHLQAVFPAARVYGGPGRFGFNPESFLDETSPLATDENAQRIWSAWSQHWDLSCNVLLEKSPPTLVRTRFLQALFPNSSFVMIVRHPLAVAMATLKWCPPDPVMLVKHWVACHHRFERDRPNIRKLVVMRYEDLVAESASCVSALYGFANLRSYQPNVSISDDLNEPYFEEWRQFLADNPQSAAEFNAGLVGYEELCSRYGYPINP